MFNALYSYVSWILAGLKVDITIDQYNVANLSLAYLVGPGIYFYIIINLYIAVTCT